VFVARRSTPAPRIDIADDAAYGVELNRRN